MDYRKFLGATQTMVLPYLGGLSVHAADRRLRVTQRVAVGWWRFEIKGRHATPKEPAEAPESFDALPTLRGHLAWNWLFTGGDTAHRLHLMPEEEAPVLSPATAKRWPSDHVLFDAVAFEDEAEEAARAALLDDATVETIKGVTPSLRGAFGFARVLRKGRARGLNVSPREVLARVHEVADGRLAPDELLDEMEARRFQIQPTSQHRRHPVAPRTRPSAATPENAQERADTVLEAAGAELLNSRIAGDRNLEIVFRYLGEQFIAMVDWETLHVYDSGICLEGQDERLGLDSLPSVIAEAIANGELYITRR